MHHSCEVRLLMLMNDLAQPYRKVCAQCMCPCDPSLGPGEQLSRMIGQLIINVSRVIGAHSHLSIMGAILGCLLTHVIISAWL